MRAKGGLVMILLGLIFIVVVALAVVAAARPWAASKMDICTANNPMPAGGTEARWYHPDTEKIADDGLHVQLRCRHCGFEIDHIPD